MGLALEDWSCLYSFLLHKYISLPLENIFFTIKFNAAVNILYSLFLDTCLSFSRICIGSGIVRWHGTAVLLDGFKFHFFANTVLSDLKFLLMDVKLYFKSILVFAHIIHVYSIFCIFHLLFLFPCFCLGVLFWYTSSSPITCCQMLLGERWC